MDALITWLYASSASHLMNDHAWSWPIAESIHFFGLVLMTGTVGAFDLRLLGYGKGVRPADLHRLLRYGIFGFVLMLITGLLFISGAPEQYFYNSSFHLKVISLALIGINVILFYSLEFSSVKALAAHDNAPRRAKLMASASLILLALVILFGRMLTFFRPVF